MIQLAENFDTLGGFCGNAFSCRIRATADASVRSSTTMMRPSRLSMIC